MRCIRALLWTATRAFKKQKMPFQTVQWVVVGKSQNPKNPKIPKFKNLKINVRGGCDCTGKQVWRRLACKGPRLVPICCQPSGSPGAAPKLCVEVARASGCVFDSCAQLLVVPPFAWTDPTTARRCATTARPQRRCSNSRDATARLQRQGSNCEAPTARLRRRGSNGVAPTAGLRRTATL